MNDPIYKRLFSFPRMVADLVRAVCDPRWLVELDFRTLEKLPAEYVGDRSQQRRGDAVWRIRFRGGWLYLLLEFQSDKNARMALRNLVYTALLYVELDRAGQLDPPGDWPTVVPLVLYNGDTPWADTLEMRDLFSAVPESVAPCQPSQRSLVLDERRVVAEHLRPDNLMRGVVGFEQSRTPDDLARVAQVLDGWLHYPADADLGLAFRDWMAATVERMVPGAPAELGRTLKEATMTLAERMAEWPKQWHQEGLAQGRREGAAHQSALLRRLAATRFGDAAGDEGRSLLVGTDDWERLGAVAELIVRADSAAELTNGVARITRAVDLRGSAPASSTDA